MEIRPEMKEDVAAIREVNRGAFGREQEARLVDDLRAAGYARLSLVAGEALDRCAAAGHRIAVLLGHPGYYPRFGFSADLAKNLSSAYSGGAFMVLELVAGALSGVSGEFAFAPPFEAAS